MHKLRFNCKPKEWAADGNFIRNLSFFCIIQLWTVFFFIFKWSTDGFMVFTHGNSRDGSVILVHTNISQQLLDWFRFNFCTDVYGPEAMNPHDFGDPRTFPLAPPWGWNLWFWVECLDSCCHKILSLMSPSGLISIILM